MTAIVKASGSVLIYAWTVQLPPTEKAARASRPPQAMDRRPLPPALPEGPQRPLLRRRSPLPPRRRLLRLCVCHCAVRTRIQIFACGPDAQMNRAATDGVLELLGSLNSRETRLLLIWGHFASDREDRCKIYAMIEPACVVSLCNVDSVVEARRELAALRVALLRILRSAVGEISP